MNIASMKLLLEILSEFQQFRAREHWTRELLEAHQAKALRGLRDYTYAHSPFYQQFHKGFYHAPLQELPVLTKAMLMEHFDDLVTDREIHLQDVQAYVANRRGDERFLGRYLVNATSGSTGHPGLFLATNTEWLTILASFARGLQLAGIKVKLTHRIKTAMIASPSPFHMSMNSMRAIHGWWMPGPHLAATEPVTSLVEHLNAWQPELLVAYPSLLRILADEQLAGRLQIAPRIVFTGAEVLMLNVNEKYGSARITAAALAYSVSSPPSLWSRSCAVLAR